MFASRWVWKGLALGALAVGLVRCSALLQFDEDKIPGNFADASFGGAGSGGLASGGVGAGSLPSSGGVGSGGVGSGGVGSGGVGSGGAPAPACTVGTNAGCAANELCCLVGQVATCKATSLDECEACGVACGAGLATACNGRSCGCGTRTACSGADAERFCLAGPPETCAECRDSTDCAGRGDGKTRCVDGLCAACDPGLNNAGCGGNTPICDPATRTCKACATTPNDCPSPLLCTAGGACGSCASSNDCASVTTPICDPGTTICRGCTGNQECVDGLQKAYCVGQTCSECSPTTEAGCGDPTKPDCREDSTGAFSCQACQNDGHCAGHPGTVCDVGTGRCVGCVSDNDCASQGQPLCSANVCVACDTIAGAATVADSRCSGKAGGKPVCIRTGSQKGECGACDPDGSSRGCDADSLCCEAAGVAACVATSLSQCTTCGGGGCNATLANNCSSRGCRCGAGAACTGTGSSRFCVGSPGTCEECRNDADCATAAAPLCSGGQCVACNLATSPNARCAAEVTGSVCAGSGALAGQCRDCDPATDTGCAAGEQCAPATATCVDCVDASGCTTATAPICGAGNACRACASDAECVTRSGGARPLCAPSGACLADDPCASGADCDGNHPVCTAASVCRFCDPGTSTGCAPALTCSAAFVCE